MRVLPKSVGANTRLFHIATDFKKLNTYVLPEEQKFLESTYNMFINHLIGALVRAEEKFPKAPRMKVKMKPGWKRKGKRA